MKKTAIYSKKLHVPHTYSEVINAFVRIVAPPNTPLSLPRELWLRIVHMAIDDFNQAAKDAVRKYMHKSIWWRVYESQYENLKTWNDLVLCVRARDTAICNS